MIYELRTYDLKPGSVDAMEKAQAEALPIREKYSKLAGWWHTDIGPLNQVVHLWPYESLAQIPEISAAARNDPSGKWPPRGGDHIVEMEVAVLQPAPFMKPLELPKQFGDVYELRIYTYQPGAMPRVLAAWEESLPYREKYSPLVGAWTSQFGPLNRFYHLWAYKDLAERSRIRAEATKDPSGKWPPQTREWMLRQESKILLPAAFSALH